MTKLHVNKGRTCSWPPCDEDAFAKGMCSTHYHRNLRGQDMSKPKTNRRYHRGEFGDWKKNSEGYVYRTRQREDGSQHRELQHRRIMSDHLGRELERHEEVHHINGVRDDNRIENFELWSTKQPKGQRVEDKLTWALDMIRLYGEGSEYANANRRSEEVD